LAVSSATLAIRLAWGGSRSWSACWYLPVCTSSQPGSSHRPDHIASRSSPTIRQCWAEKFVDATARHRRQPTVYQAPPPEYRRPIRSSEERRRRRAKARPLRGNSDSGDADQRQALLNELEDPVQGPITETVAGIAKQNASGGSPAQIGEGNGNGWMHQEMGSQVMAQQVVPGGQWGREQLSGFEAKPISRRSRKIEPWPLVAVLVTKRSVSPLPRASLKTSMAPGIGALSSTRTPLISRKSGLHHEDRAVEPQPIRV